MVSLGRARVDSRAAAQFTRQLGGERLRYNNEGLMICGLHWLQQAALLLDDLGGTVA